MTDIQRHLKGIRKILYTALDESGQYDAMDTSVVMTAIQKYLPDGYGVGAGVLVKNDEKSAHAQIIVYDVPLAGGIYPEGTQDYPIETALFVLYFAGDITRDRFSEYIRDIASIKKLAKYREIEPRKTNQQPVGQARRIIPKDRLPFILLYLDRVVDSKNLYADMIDIMREYEVDVLPDQIDIIGKDAQYYNPLLERHPAHTTDIGWSITPNLRKPKNCYVCKQKYMRRHFYYDQLCITCGDLNYSKRMQTIDLTGYRVLVTGARVKIGYAVALRLLRAGAEVIITSRFPRNAAQRYSQESDFETWRDRLHIYGLDLRQVSRLETFVAYLKTTYSHLDAIINNAAQTVKRPPVFYAHLLEVETKPIDQLPEPMRPLLAGNPEDNSYIQPSIAGLLEGEEVDEDFPTGEYDEHGEQVDNRDYNSWVMHLEEIPPVEFAEVHLVNAIAPGILAGQLKTMLLRSPHDKRFIINVSALEGRFTTFKNGYHPHTNMAKAALNMLTCTIAEHYAEDAIYVTSVDPGWVSDQVPRTNEDSRSISSDMLPIDMLDAATRIIDPIVSTIDAATPLYGVLLKDYLVIKW